jgi:hypothetical protein
MTTIEQLKVGDLVTVSESKYPNTWTVVKVNKVNVRLSQNGRYLNASPFFLTKVEGEIPAAVIGVRYQPVPEPLAIGAVVRCEDKPGLWVVVRDGVDRVNVAKLGGDGGRYLRAPRERLTQVDDIAAAIIDSAPSL